VTVGHRRIKRDLLEHADVVRVAGAGRGAALTTVARTGYI